MTGPPPAPWDDAAARTLPASLDAERAVLGAILINDRAYLDTGQILAASGEDFFRDAHRRIYAQMAKILDRPGGGLDFVVLSEALARAGEMDEIGGPGYLVSLTDGMTRATNVKHYAGIVREKARLRAVIQAGNAMVDAAYDQDGDADELIGLADRSILALRNGGRDGAMQSLAQSASAFESDLSWRIAHQGELSGIPSGLSAIDAMTNGWQAGDVIVVGARPSMGKTAITLKFARAAAETTHRTRGDRHRVAIFSMEMRRLQLEYRLLSDLSGIALTRLTTGFVAEHEMPRLAEAQARMQALDLYVDDTPGLTAEDVRAKCRARIADGGLDLVVIDYVQLMVGSTGRRGANRNEELTDTSRKIKKMAGELGVAVLLLSQLKRTEGRPQLSDLRESGSIEQDADIVAFLHRKDHRVSGPTEFIIAKARNGPTGTVMTTFNRDIQRFEDAPDEAEQAPEPEDEAPRRAPRPFAKRPQKRD